MIRNNPREGTAPVEGSAKTGHSLHAKRRHVGPLVCATLIATAVALSQGQQRASILVGGRVEDSKTGAELPGTQIILQFKGNAAPLTTYTNAKGGYTFTATGNAAIKGATITASNPTYQRRTLTINSTATLDQFDFLLEPLTGPTSQQVKPRTVQSSDFPSGIGANWSGWYQLCSEPVQPGERIGSNISFELGGDRHCGAWSECRETVRSQQQVCWQFRMQGHSESFPPRPASSHGILHYTIEQGTTAADTSTTNGLVYVQIVREALRPFADRLVTGLNTAGYTAPGTQNVMGSYHNEIRYFHTRDAEGANKLRLRVLQLLRDAGHPIAIKTIFVDGYDASAKLQQYEIWLAE